MTRTLFAMFYQFHPSTGTMIRFFLFFPSFFSLSFPSYSSSLLSSPPLPFLPSPLPPLSPSSPSSSPLLLSLLFPFSFPPFPLSPFLLPFQLFFLFVKAFLPCLPL